MSEEKKKTGRPTQYKEEYNEQARKLCLMGATDKDLADFFDIAESTLNLWKTKHERFVESIKEGKRLADATVAEKLYHRAIGYQHEETKIVSYEGQVTDQVNVIKHYAPDPTAAIFWLKNRQPEKWRDKRENVNVEISHEQWLDSLE